MGKTIPMLDLMFFLTETADNPKHVAGLLLFEPPEGAGKRFVADLVAAYRKAPPVAPFDQVPEFPLARMPRWVKATDIDMKYHVQHLALPAGATHADLLDLVGELHAQVLDRSRPGFRSYFIEGLPDGGFALFLKIHHAMIDGKSAMARIEGSLDPRPGTRAIRATHAVGFDAAQARPDPARADALAAMRKLAVRQALAFKDLYANLLRKGRAQPAGGPGSVPFTAPHGPTTARTTAGRSVATLSLPLDEMKAVGKAFGGTLNDVAVTIADAGVLGYLKERGHASGAPMVALCPVSLREAGDKEASTKASTLFARLGEPQAPIGERMRQVVSAIRSAKDELRRMSKDAATLYAIVAFGLGELADVLRAGGATRPLANFVLSNVPGSPHELYLRGARLAGIYPISALGAGIGLNITLVSHANTMNIGFVGNGAALPDLDRMAQHTRRAFAALKKAAARQAPPRAEPAGKRATRAPRPAARRPSPARRAR